MITLVITLKDSSGDIASESAVAEKLPAAFTLGRMIRFAVPGVPFEDDDIADDDKEVTGRVVSQYDPATGAVTVEIDDSRVEAGYELSPSDLRCPTSEHCCAAVAMTAAGGEVRGLGLTTDPLILPWPVDEQGDSYPADEDGNPIIPLPGAPDCSIDEILVQEGQSSVLIGVGNRPLGVREANGYWGFSIAHFNAESGAVALSATVPDGVLVYVQFAPCSAENEIEES